MNKWTIETSTDKDGDRQWEVWSPEGIKVGQYHHSSTAFHFLRRVLRRTL